MNSTKIVGKVFRFLVYCFILSPLLVVIISSFSDTRLVAFPPRGFTLRWFNEAMKNREFINSVTVSLKIATISVIFSLILGTMISLYFWKIDNFFTIIIENIFLSPIVVPTIISGVAFLQYFALFHNITSFWKLCLAYTSIQIPYVIRSVTSSLVGLDISFEEAALVLGATPLRTLFGVTLPCIKRGLVASTIFSFIVAFDEAVIIMFLKTANTITYPLRLYSYITESFTPLISAFSTIFILISFIVVLIVEKRMGLSKLY